MRHLIMPKRGKGKRKVNFNFKFKEHGTYFIAASVILLTILLLNGGFRNNISSLLISAARMTTGGTYDISGGCAKTGARPCYDKLTSSGVNFLSKNGENTFTSCASNAAPNKVGEIIQKTSFCGQEKVQYCHDGKSNNFLRKFTGTCDSGDPLPPTPTPMPTPTANPNSSFKITYPNGGEQLPFGSQQVVRWEGGDQTNTWPIYLSLVDRDRNVAIREMVIESPNDGQEDWIVDLPLGNYYIFYGQGCRFGTCVTASQWDQSDLKFSVVAGSPIGKVNSSYPLNKSLVILSPSGGEAWASGSSQSIKWSGLDSSSSISLYLVDDKQSYVSISNSSANDGIEQWTVPGFVPPGQYKVYSTCTNCGVAPSGTTGGFYNYSFYPFTIK